MASKSSRLHLYAADNLAKKGLFINASNLKTEFQVPDKFEINAPSFALKGHTNSLYNIEDLHYYLYNEKSTKDAKNASQDTSISTLQTDLASETVNRQSAVTSVQNAVSAETSARTSADDAINASLTQEVADRTSADNALQTAISQEVTDRTNAVSSEASARQTAMQAETDARTSAVSAVNARVDAILDGTSVNTDQLIEIVNAYQNADTSIIDTITALQTNFDDLKVRFDELVSNEESSSSSASSDIINGSTWTGSSPNYTITLSEPNESLNGSFTKVYFAPAGSVQPFINSSDVGYSYDGNVTVTLTNAYMFTANAGDDLYFE